MTVSVRPWEGVSAELVDRAHNIIGWSNGAKYPDILELHESAALLREAAVAGDALAAEVAKLRDEVGLVMRREKHSRVNFAKWTHRLYRRIQKLKANIADEESYIETLRRDIATRPDCQSCGGAQADSGGNYLDCPDQCLDGKVTVAQMATLWDMRDDIITVAQHVRSHCDRPYEQADRLLDHLRSVRLSPSPKEGT